MQFFAPQLRFVGHVTRFVNILLAFFFTDCRFSNFRERFVMQLPKRFATFYCSANEWLGGLKRGVVSRKIRASVMQCSHSPILPPPHTFFPSPTHQFKPIPPPTSYSLQTHTCRMKKILDSN